MDSASSRASAVASALGSRRLAGTCAPNCATTPACGRSLAQSDPRHGARRSASRSCLPASGSRTSGARLRLLGGFTAGGSIPTWRYWVNLDLALTVDAGLGLVQVGDLPN